jgi:polyisoprenoid-binding protein YceI
MNKKSILLMSLGILFFSDMAVGADKYVIDPSHTSIGFSIRHMVINKVKGDFKDYTANFIYDEQNISRSSVSAVIQVASIDTGNEERDQHLRSPDFFDVKRFPAITFRSNKIEKTGDKEFLATGTLEMHGVVKEIGLRFTIVGKVKDPWGKTRMGVESEYTLNRLDYGLSWEKRMEDGGLVVGHAVKIEMNFEMIKMEH